MNRLLVISILTISLLTNAFTQDEKVEHIQLTKSDVTTFINSFPQILEDFKKLEVKYDSENHEFNMSESSEVLDEINAVVSKYGYKDYVEFYTKAATISLTYAALKLEMENANAQPEIEAAIKEIESSDYYTAEQKEQMIAMMKQSSQTIETVSEDMANDKNIAVVTPYLDQIEKALDAD